MSLWENNPEFEVTDNKISENRSGIECHSSTKAIITINKITDNIKGIDCRDMSAPTISNNTFKGNKNIAIDCYDFSCPKITGNNISGSRIGIARIENSKPALEDNKFNDNEENIFEFNAEREKNRNV